MLRPANIVFILILTIIINVNASELILDICRFKGENGKAILELYVDLPRTAVTYRAENNKWYGSIAFKVEVLKDSVILATDKWRIDDLVTDPKVINQTQRIVDIRPWKRVHKNC